MTSPVSDKPIVRPLSRAFTLIEMLVVIGILVTLIGILIPMVIRAMRSGERAKTAAIIQTLSVAIDSYYNDHQEYPPIAATNMGPFALGRYLYAPGPDVPASTSASQAPAWAGTNSYSYGDMVLDGGATYVCISTAATSAATSDTTKWQPMGFADGADGPGFRKRGTQGTIYTYLAPERITIRGLAILDPYDNPILYYPAHPGKPNVTTAGGYVSNTGTALYDSRHSQAYLSQNNLRLMLGDMNYNGAIGAGETPNYTGPYILWSAGPDGNYGPSALNATEAARCDDVTNFR